VRVKGVILNLSTEDSFLFPLAGARKHVVLVGIESHSQAHWGI
jgi:hypothetical protein